MTRLLFALAFFFALSKGLQAHPVAQGSMEVRAHDHGVSIFAKVANEQIFVAEAHSADSMAVTQSEVWERHGTYLLEHVRVTADGQPVEGRLIKTIPPENVTADGRTGYQLEFPFPAAGQRPSEIALTQSVLNEIEFAPGNRWEATYLTRIVHPGGRIEEGLLFTSTSALPVKLDWSTATGKEAAPRMDRARLAADYLWHGVTHILTGYDHLLFVAALVLAARTLMDLIKVVTAFTIAHSLTLTLSVLGWVRLPSSIVEPVIAGSIVVVALQNVFTPERGRGWSRLAFAFLFGLFHGLGFAGGLLDTMAELPGATVALALGAFSVGVELGHAVVVIPLFGTLQLARLARRKSSASPGIWAHRFASLAISCAGGVYLVAALRG